MGIASTTPRPDTCSVQPELEARSAEAQVLQTLRSDSLPLTLRQLHSRTGVPVGLLDQATRSLCVARSIRRLNTIVESFCPNNLEQAD